MGLKKAALSCLVVVIFLVLSTTGGSAQDLRCAICGKVIAGHYKVLNGEPYCSETCVAEALPQCSVCGKPSERYIREAGNSGKIYCSPECLHTTLSKCEICGEPLTRWVSVNEHKYCSNCARRPRCFNCRLPGAQNRLADGRHICSTCIGTAIIDQRQAEPLFRQVREDIHTHLNLRTPHSIRFYLRDGAAFSALIGDQNFTHHGYYEASSKYRVRGGVESLASGNYAIYILSALTPPHFRNAVAHELGHDISHALYRAVRKKEDVEGFAEYISALMNHHWGSDRLNEEKLENADKDYADAYRKFLQIGSKNGLRDVLAYMEAQNRIARRTLK